MVHVRVRDEDGAHALLLLERERVRDGARVHAERVVHEEGRLPVSGRGAAVGSENANAHGSGIMRPRATRDVTPVTNLTV